MCENLWLKQLPNHFIFRLLHYCHIALQLRDELAGKATPQRRHSYYQSQPFALWLTHLLLTYAADMLVNVLLGALPLEPLSNAPDVLLCSICWYLIFYSPYDMVHALARTLGFRLLAAPVNAINQLLVIDRGIYEAGRVYGQHAILPILVVGTILGSGAELLKPVAALLINRCQQSSAAFVKLSTNSKLSLLVCCLQLLQHHRNSLLLGLSAAQLQRCLLYLLLGHKCLLLLRRYRWEHFIWLWEQRLCYACFGGLYVDLINFFQAKHKCL